MDYLLFATDELGGDSINWDRVIIHGNESGNYSFSHAPDREDRIIFYKVKTFGIIPAFYLQADYSYWPGMVQGEEAEVASYEVASGVSSMLLNRISLDFDQRLWLYVHSLTILDDTKVIAQTGKLSAGDFAEIGFNAGFDYRLSIPLTDYTVPRGETRHLTVRVLMLPVINQKPVDIKIRQIETRTTDTSGISDKWIASSTQSFGYADEDYGRVTVGVDPKGFLEDFGPRIVQISSVAETDNIRLASYEIKVQDVRATLRSLSFQVNSSVPLTSIFADIKIEINDHWYSADILDESGPFKAVFLSLNEVLPLNATVPLVIYGKVKPDTTGSFTGATIAIMWRSAGTARGEINNPLVENENGETLDVAENVSTAKTLIFVGFNAVVSDVSAHAGPSFIWKDTQSAALTTFSFTVAAGDTALYMSTRPETAIVTSIAGYADEKSSRALVSVFALEAAPMVNAGDAYGYYIIPAGSSRKFKATGLIKSESGVAPSAKSLAITEIKYGRSSEDLSISTIKSGLEDLRINIVF